jgi:hypothetical protein
MATKLIYGVGRTPKASEFALGDIIVNVDDSKVFSKNKNNTVFEIGSGTTSTTVNNITGYLSASINTGSINHILSSSGNDNNLVISGGIGISIETSSTQPNSIILSATGETISIATNALTASYVEASSIDGTIDVSSQTNFTVSDTTGQTGINLTFDGSGDDLTAFASGLGTSSPVQFANITSSGNISASGNLFASSSDAGGNIYSVTLIDTASGRFYHTSSEAIGGLQTLQQVTDQGPSTTTPITASIISASGDIFAKRLRLPSGTTTDVSGIIFDEQAGNSGFIYDDGVSLQLGYNDVDIITVSSSNDFKLLVGGGARIASGRLKVEGNITASNPDGISHQGNISASGALFASMSVSGNLNYKTVVYDETEGKFYITGSYGGPAPPFTITGTDKRVLYFDGNDNPSGDGGFTYDDVKEELTLAGNITSSARIKAATAVNAPRFERNDNNYLSFTEAGANTLRFVANGAKVLDFKNDVLHINPLKTNIDFRVDGDTNPLLLVADAQLENVGIGTTASFGVNLIPEKLTVEGNISASGFLRLNVNENTTGVAGALLYSASNEFYLGFSS